MSPKRSAGVDIGTNTLLMIIIEADSAGNVKVISDNHSIARLGENVDKAGFISQAAADRAAKILANYRKILDQYKIDNIRLSATSAMRDAANRDEIKSYLERIIAAPIEIIDGKAEASLSFLGTVNDSRYSSLIDIGGGSTELVIGVDKKVTDALSLDIGAVRISERFFSKLPPNRQEIQAAVEFVRENLAKVTFDLSDTVCYGVAGTPTTIASNALELSQFDALKVNGYILDKITINHYFKLYSSQSQADLVSKFNIHPDRAKIITAGALILRETMEYFDIPKINVSIYGLRMGLAKSVM